MSTIYKIIYLTTILLFTFVYCFSQNNKIKYSDCIKVDIGAYTTGKKVKRVFAVTSKDTCNIYLIGVTPSNSGIQTLGLKCDGPVFYLHYSDTLYTTFKKIEKKYKEWTEIAENNVTGQFEKVIPIEMPIAGVAVWNIDKPQFELLDVDKKCFYFYNSNLANETPCINIHMFSYFSYYNETFRRKANPRVEVISYFSNPEQFDTFVELLSPNKIRQNMGNKTIDALFK